MNTDNNKEQNPNFEVDYMAVKPDEYGKLRTGMFSKNIQVQDTTNDVVFTPAFDLDKNSMDPALVQALEARARARKTEASVRRNGIGNKSHDVR